MRKVLPPIRCVAHFFLHSSTSLVHFPFPSYPSIRTLSTPFQASFGITPILNSSIPCTHQDFASVSHSHPHLFLTHIPSFCRSKASHQLLKPLSASGLSPPCLSHRHLLPNSFHQQPLLQVISQTHLPNLKPQTPNPNLKHQSAIRKNGQPPLPSYPFSLPSSYRCLSKAQEENYCNQSSEAPRRCQENRTNKKVKRKE